MACCALNLGHTVFTGDISRELASRLFDSGFDVVQLELGEFIKGGGAARSLALRLSDLPNYPRRPALVFRWVLMAKSGGTPAHEQKGTVRPGSGGHTSECI